MLHVNLLIIYQLKQLHACLFSQLGYMSQGFLGVQHAVAKNFMKNLMPSQNLQLDLQMCRYPFPPYLDDKFIMALQLFFPMIICFSFIYPAVNIVKNIVVEKEKKLKVSFKILVSIVYSVLNIIYTVLIINKNCLNFAFKMYCLIKLQKNIYDCLHLLLRKDLCKIITYLLNNDKTSFKVKFL